MAFTPKGWLREVLDEEHADEVINHRQRLRKPLTAFAAKLLARKLAACADPNAAAEMMIEKGWQSIEPGWVQNSQQRAIVGNARSVSSVSSVFSGLVSQMESGNGIRRIQGNEGYGEDVPRLPFAFDE